MLKVKFKRTSKRLIRQITSKWLKSRIITIPNSYTQLMSLLKSTTTMTKLSENLFSSDHQICED